MLRRQWPVSVVAGMSQRQTELELMRHACKERFRVAQTGCNPYCSTNIKHDMARHVSSFHLDLSQLWWCPVSWCTQWKGTPQDCVDHIRKKHYVNDSVKAANLGRWFPPWTVTREAWHMTLNTKLSGISTDATLFSEWVSVGTPLQGVRTMCCTCVSARNLHEQSPVFHHPGLRQCQVGG